ARAVALALPASRAGMELSTRVDAAVALGRGGRPFADSARRVLADVLRRAPASDHDLRLLAALAYEQLGDRDRALEQFRAFAALNLPSPAQMRRTVSEMYVYRDLKSDPRFQAIFGL